MKREGRRRWLAVHRWLGLTFGLVFSLIGLTGSALVFDHATDEWLNPDLLLTPNGGTPAPIEDVIKAAEAAFSGRALSVSKPRVAAGVYEVWFQSGTQQQPKYTQVLVDPYTADVKGQRVWGEYFMTWLYRLHFQMLAGENGGTFVGAVGIAVLVSIASGIYLWWPLWLNSWRAALSFRPGKQVYDVHKTTGIVASALLAVIAFSGVYMEFPDASKAVLSALSSVTEHPTDLKSTFNDSQQPLSPDRAIAIAGRSFPGADFDHLHPPVGVDGVYEVAFRQADEVQQSFGRSQVFLDQYSGAVLKIHSPHDFTAADAFIAWQFPLHNGEALGLPGRWLVFVSGFLPAGLYITGLMIYWRRHRKQRSTSVFAENGNRVANVSSESRP